jgi:hypothetical protein
LLAATGIGKTIFAMSEPQPSSTTISGIPFRFEWSFRRHFRVEFLDKIGIVSFQCWFRIALEILNHGFKRVFDPTQLGFGKMDDTIAGLASVALSSSPVGMVSCNRFDWTTPKGSKWGHNVFINSWGDGYASSFGCSGLMTLAT